MRGETRVALDYSELCAFVHVYKMRCLSSLCVERRTDLWEQKLLLLQAFTVLLRN